MGPACRSALAVLVVAGGIVAAPVAGGRESPPLASVACARIAPGVCEESGDIKVGPDAYGSQATDTVPGTSTQEQTFLDPLNTQDLADFDSLWEGVADGYPKFAGVHNTTVRRVITCALFSRYLGNMYTLLGGGRGRNLQVTSDNAYAAVLAICIQVAVLGQQSSSAALGARAARHPCSTAVVSIPVQVSRSGSGYAIKSSAAVKRAAGGGPLAFACGSKGKGTLIKVRARSGRKLRRVVGPSLRLGYSNQSAKAVGVRATFRFH
jgi:hypothetical protein